MDDESSRKPSVTKHSAPASRVRGAELEGARVLILSGKFKGEEGVCLGRDSGGNLWPVSPDCAAEILSLTFEKDFALLVDLSSDPKRN
jgi:hypothetical protein